MAEDSVSVWKVIPLQPIVQTPSQMPALYRALPFNMVDGKELNVILPAAITDGLRASIVLEDLQPKSLPRPLGVVHNALFFALLPMFRFYLQAAFDAGVLIPVAGFL